MWDWPVACTRRPASAPEAQHDPPAIPAIFAATPAATFAAIPAATPLANGNLVDAEARLALTAIAAVLLLLGAGLAIALRGNPARAAASLGTQGIATALVLVDSIPRLYRGGELRHSVAWSYPVEQIATALDPLGAFFLSWSLPMTFLGTVYATGYLRPYYGKRNAGVQFALLNLTSLAFILIYTVQNALVFLLGWEIAAVAAWLLVIWEYGSQKVRFAGFNYLVSTHVGLFFLVAAFMVLHSQTGSLDFGDFGTWLRTTGAAGALAHSAGTGEATLRDAVFVLLVTAFGLKSAFFPFHTWLPRAHSAAPAHVSALMSGVIHKAGLYGLLRVTLLMGRPDEWMGWFLIGVSVCSALFGVLYTTAQRDLKRLLGYSSTENVGIAGIGFGLGYLGLAWNKPALVLLGFTGGILHILNHALFKCLLFYAAGAVYRATHSVDLEHLGGLAKKMPYTAFFFLCGGVAISALPPLNGFVSEFLVYSGLLGEASVQGVPRVLFVATAALLAFVGGISALAMTRSFGIAFLGAPRSTAVRCEGEVGLAMRVPMAIHAFGIVLLGLIPGVGLAIVRRPARLFVDLLGAGEPVSLAQAAPLAEVGAVFAILLLVIGALVFLRRWLGRKAAAPHVTWGCGYPAPTPRMQYTGTSYSALFADSFRAILVQLRRERSPEGPFPQAASEINTHTVDAVERRLFEVLGEGDDWVKRTANHIPEESRFSFGLGLVFVAGLVGLILSGAGVLR